MLDTIFRTWQERGVNIYLDFFEKSLKLPKYQRSNISLFVCLVLIQYLERTEVISRCSDTSSSETDVQHVYLCYESSS